MEWFLLLSSIALYIFIPVLLLSGWRRWAQHRPVESRASVRSLLGFTLGTASALLAAGSIIYAGASGGFHHYAPTLIGFYRLGIVVPLAGLTSGLAGMLGRNPLRWHAPTLSLSMLLVWLIWLSAE